MNQGDRIRVMNNEELADLLHNIQTEWGERDYVIDIAFEAGDEYEIRDTYGDIKEFLDSEMVDVYGYDEDEVALKLNKWIPVEERLPETHTEYVKDNPWIDISWFKDTYQLSDPVLGYGKRKAQSDDDPMMAVVWYEDDGGGRTAWITCPDCEDIDVVAWMPLPEPYREDEEE